MKVQFTVTVEGHWLENGKPVTSGQFEKNLREAARERFEFLADSVKVVKVLEGSDK